MVHTMLWAVGEQRRELGCSGAARDSVGTLEDPGLLRIGINHRGGGVG